MRKISNIINFIQEQRTEEEVEVTTGISTSSRVEEYNFKLGKCIFIHLKLLG